MTTSPSPTKLDLEPVQLAAALLAIAPHQLGGIGIRAPAGAPRDSWIAEFVAASHAHRSPTKIPLSVTDDALDGGVDLSATLASGRPIHRSGLLNAAQGGTVVIPMAERWTREAIARITRAMDRADASCRFAVIALDEGIDDEERLPAGLFDRMAFHIELEPRAPDAGQSAPMLAAVARARELLRDVRISEEIVESLVLAAAQLAIHSSRAALFAVHAARAHASLYGRTDVIECDAVAASTLVLAPRALQLPSPTADEPTDQKDPEDNDTEPTDEEVSEPQPSSEAAMADRIVEATVAQLPKNLLDSIKSKSQTRRVTEQGRRHAAQGAGQRGRPIGVRRGDPKRGARLNIPATLLAAAPWQMLRGRVRQAGTHQPYRFRMDDLRVDRVKQTTKVTTVFAVDASGSAALHRLAEAKGAVEQLLAESYVRRARVALISFRARQAELLLPPTSALARARKALAEIPGGGATPLAGGLRQAHLVANSIDRSGQHSIVVLLTDGCANVDIDGRGGRQRATEDALKMASHIRADGIPAIVIDTSPMPGPQSRRIAEAMGAIYVPLPHGNANSISQAVRQFSRFDSAKARRPG